MGLGQGSTNETPGVAGERRRLIGLAYRMLGTVSEAEDAVQEAFLRWYRLSEQEREKIINPAGWLTRATSRICLDVLGSARVRREKYVGQWLPEPLAPGYLPDFETAAPSDTEDPLNRITLDDSVSTALMVVLEAMTPAERVAFVLHDVFAYSFDEIADIVGRSSAATRQLASSARRRIKSERTRLVNPRDHAQVVEAFREACRRGDLDELTRVLDPDIILRSDGGGVVRAALNPILGASKAGRFLLGVLKKQPAVHLEPIETNDGPALALVSGSHVTGIVTLLVQDGLVAHIWIQWNPAKLSSWEGQAVATSQKKGTRRQ